MLWSSLETSLPQLNIFIPRQLITQLGDGPEISWLSDKIPWGHKKSCHLAQVVGLQLNGIFLIAVTSRLWLDGIFFVYNVLTLSLVSSHLLALSIIRFFSPSKGRPLQKWRLSLLWPSLLWFSKIPNRLYHEWWNTMNVSLEPTLKVV